MLEAAVIFGLLLFNGLFAMIEIAVVSSRKSRLRQWSEAGDPRARVALALAESPNRFLSTVQLGITLVGVLAGAFGGATIARQLGEWLRKVPWLADWADVLGVGIVVASITFVSLVIGELVPKRIGLAHPEGIARLAARPMLRLSRLALPLVHVLGVATDAVVRLLRVKPAADAGVGEEEVRMLAREGQRAGALLPAETRMLEGVLELDHLTVHDIMVPRGQVVWLNLRHPDQQSLDRILASGHTRFPVHGGRRDDVAGIVSIKRLHERAARGQPFDLRAVMEAPLIVPTARPVIGLLEDFRARGTSFALAADEFGGIAGVVTLHDAMKVVLGELAEPEGGGGPSVTRREDGSLLVDALIRIDELEEHCPGLPVDPEPERDYLTLGGFILRRLDHIPRTGEILVAGDFRIEIVDLDGNRIDKVLITAPAPREVAAGLDC